MASVQRGIGAEGLSFCIRLYCDPHLMADLFDLSITTTRSRSTGKQPHLFKHAGLGIDDIQDVWQSDPPFYPAKPSADWLMVAEVHGEILVVPLAPSDSNDPTRCRPIGCHVAAQHLAGRYLEDR